MKIFKSTVMMIALVLGLSIPVFAVQLDGLMTVDKKIMEKVCIVDENGDPVIDPETGECILSPVPVFISGSYFSMGSDNPLMGVSLRSGPAGGIALGTYQNFVLNPDVPHPQGWKGDTNGDGIPDGAAGTGYARTPTLESDALKSFPFFGVNTYIGLNPISYQSGEAHPAPAVWVDTNGNLTAELSSWEVMWNGSAFEQGPRPSNTGPFVLAEGTYDFDTGYYVVGWKSQIKGGPFNGVPGFWHLEGTIIPEPLMATAFAEPQTLNVKSQGNGFSVTISVQDVNGSAVTEPNIMQGVSIISVGAVDIPEGEITENVAGRTILGDELKLAFDDPATGNRQDIIAAVSNVPDKSYVDVCVAGSATDADGIKRPFEACDTIKINNKGNR